MSILEIGHRNLITQVRFKYVSKKVWWGRGAEEEGEERERKEEEERRIRIRGGRWREVKRSIGGCACLLKRIKYGPEELLSE